MTVGGEDHAPSGGDARASAPQDGPSAPATVGALVGDSDMEISDDDRPLPSSVSSCLPTHPPPHQDAYDFLSSLLLEPEGDGEAGVCSWARPVDPAGGALVAMIPGDGTVAEEGAGVCPGARPVEPEGEGGCPGDATVDGGASVETPRRDGATESRRQRRNRRQRHRWIARRAAENADSFLT